MVDIAAEPSSSGVGCIRKRKGEKKNDLGEVSEVVVMIRVVGVMRKGKKVFVHK